MHIKTLQILRILEILKYNIFNQNLFLIFKFFLLKEFLLLVCQFDK